MKRSSFITMILGTVSGVFFAIGMCMALLPEWNAFVPGIIFGCVGIVLGLFTWMLWRRMTGQAPIQLSGKALGVGALGILGALLLGVGMCFVMVWNRIIPGILIGLVGILALLCLIPVTRGISD